MKDRIIETSSQMFLNFGFKSVTMDDIAKNLSISKKTIYQHFKNKTELVKDVTFYMFEKISCEIDQISKQEKHPIEELFLIKSYLLKHVKNQRNSPIYQLRRFYPQIHEELTFKQFNKMKESVADNLQKGISQGLYRDNIKVDVITRFYFSGMQSIKNFELFPFEKFNHIELQNIFLEYHLRGIVTVKGLKVLQERFLNQ